MKKGNVIRCPSGSLWVVASVSNTVVQAVSFDTENLGATARLKDRTYETSCPECSHYEGEFDAASADELMDDCERCLGKGRVTVIERGWENAEVLAPNVREFILQAVRRTFGI